MSIFDTPQIKGPRKRFTAMVVISLIKPLDKVRIQNKGKSLPKKEFMVKSILERLREEIRYLIFKDSQQNQKLGQEA